MDRLNQMMLRVLINRYHSGSLKELSDYLPPSEKNAVLSQKIESQDPFPLLNKESLLRKIHPSWIKPLVEHLPPPVRALFFSFSTEQKEEFSLSHFGLSSPVQTFLFHQFSHLLKLDQHLPLEYLPQNELFVLIEGSKEKRLQLVNFLGLHDLASEVRHIVNRQYLNNIYSCLTPQEMTYLKNCLHQKEKIAAPKLGIDPTKQDCPQLKKVLHRRGLIRLGKALSDEHPDFVWHLAHRFDKSRGEFLLREASLPTPSKMTTLLKQQVIHLIHFLGDL